MRSVRVASASALLLLLLVCGLLLSLQPSHAFTVTRKPVYATSPFSSARYDAQPQTTLAAAADAAQQHQQQQPVPAGAQKVTPDDSDDDPQYFCPLDHSSTVWMCISTILVLGMSPALALFEAGMLRSKNTVSLITQVFSGVIMLSVMWVFIGYTLTFGDSVGGFIGNVHHAFFIDVHYNDCSDHAPQIPSALFAMFQMMFAVITPLLMTGSFAERLKFKSFIVFVALWELLIYYPLAHWIWGGGFLGTWGVLDFAGGIVIHTSAGIGSLVSALYLGRRKHYFDFMGEFPPSNLPLAATGAALLWIGWFGFNGGSALASGPVAVSAIVSTQVACSCGAFTWLMLGWYHNKPQAAALMNGALAGLAGITPASGYVNTPATIFLGTLFGAASYYSVVLLKHKLHVDDALDVSSVHGLTGVLGSLAIGFVAQKRIDPDGADGLFYGNAWQLLYQFVGVLFTLAYAGILTYALLRAVNWMHGGLLRANEEEEDLGLDWSEHREIAYHQLHVLDDVSVAEKPTYVNGRLSVAHDTRLSHHSSGLGENLLHGNGAGSSDDVALSSVDLNTNAPKEPSPAGVIQGHGSANGSVLSGLPTPVLTPSPSATAIQGGGGRPGTLERMPSSRDYRRATSTTH